MPKLTFDKATHTYKWDNVKVPSVTQVIESIGMIDKQWFTEESRLRGTYVHEATALHDRGKLDTDTVDPIIAPYLQAWVAFRRDTGIKCVAIERMAYSERHGYAGTLDRIIKWPDGRKAVLDIKSGVVSPWVRMQVAAYADQHGIAERYAIQLKNDGKYKLHGPWHGLTDFAAFMHAMWLGQWIKTARL